MAARNRTVDVLRALGLFLVILAHSSPPAWLFAVRNFDVVLLVLVSGMSYGISPTQRSYPQYLWSRVKRLIFPVWLFLSALFLGVAITGIGRRAISSEVMLESYLMLGGIGYVWIMRVFLTVAVLAPMLSWISDRTSSTRLYIGGIALLLFVHQAMVSGAAMLDPGMLRSWWGEMLFQGVGYALVFAIGLRYLALTWAGRAAVSVLAFAILVFSAAIVASSGAILDLQTFKYPPQLPFLAYGLLAAGLAYVIANWFCKRIREDGPVMRAIDYFSRNSVWIYLWHIPIVLLEREYHLFHGSTYFLALSFAVVISLVQRRLVAALVASRIRNRGVTKFATEVLSG